MAESQEHGHVDEDELISADSLGGTITVTVGPDVDVDFSSIEQQVDEMHVDHHIVDQVGSSISSALDGYEEQNNDEVEMQDEQVQEVIIKTEVDNEAVKVNLPPIPFSFPGQTFDTKCQKLILNVWDFFKRVKKNPDIMDEIRTPQERAAAALHISAATIGKIGKNLKKTGKLETPGAKRKRNRPIVDSVNAADEDVIRGIITEMRVNKITPTLPMVLTEARSRLNFTGGATSFRRVLQRMGYRNLSQKNVVKTKLDVQQSQQIPTSSAPSQIQYQQIQLQPHHHHQQATATYTTLKLIKKEADINPTISQNVSANPRTTTSQLNSNVIQISSAGGGQPIQLTQESAATILNAARVAGLGTGGGSQTFYIQQADNTIRPIQIVYASSLT